MTYKKSIIIYRTDNGDNFDEYKICNCIDSEDVIEQLQEDKGAVIRAVIDLSEENIKFLINELNEA